PLPGAARRGALAPVLPRPGGRGRRPRRWAAGPGVKAAARSLLRIPPVAAAGRLVHARVGPWLRTSGPAAALVHTRGLDARPARGLPCARLQPGARGSPHPAVAPGARLVGSEAARLRRKGRVLAGAGGARRPSRGQAPSSR